MTAFWQTLRPLRKVGKLRGKLEIPAFTAECGETHCSLLYAANSDFYVSTSTADIADAVSAFTIEAWVKLFAISAGVNRAIMFRERSSVGSLQYKFSLNEGKPELTVYAGGANRTYTCGTVIDVNEWQHVAVTFSVANTSVSFYINGLLIETQTYSHGNITARVDGNTVIGNDDGAGTRVFFGNIDEVRFWNIARTATQIYLAYKSPRDTTGTIDVGLKGYFKFSEGSGVTTENLITGFDWNIFSAVMWDVGENYPNRFGASFVVGEFAIEVPIPWSIKFPLAKPYDDVNFVPCIRWLGNDGVTVHRFKLWEVDGFDPYQHDLTLYNGEKIPASSVLEIWNIDGNETVDLTETLVLHTSILHNVDSPFTTSQIRDNTNTIAIDTALAEGFPLNPFPLQFAEQQTY